MGWPQGVRWQEGSDGSGDESASPVAGLAGTEGAAGKSDVDSSAEASGAGLDDGVLVGVHGRIMRLACAESRKKVDLYARVVHLSRVAALGPLSQEVCFAGDARSAVGKPPTGLFITYAIA